MPIPAYGHISQGQTVLVANIPQGGGLDQSRFSPANFAVNPELSECCCPNGVVSKQVYRHGDEEGISFRFTAKGCRDCPLWSECRSPDAFNHTPEGRALLKQRWWVEPVIAWLVRYQGCRAAQCQLYQACAVRNLLSWLGRLRQ